MKPLRWVQNGKAVRLAGIGGEFACPLPQIAYGGPKAKRRLSRFMDSHRRTLMSRPHVTRVSRTEAGRSRELNNRGNRSGRERSSPTWGHGCCGDPGWRKPADLAVGSARPPLALPPHMSNTTSAYQPGPSNSGTSAHSLWMVVPSWTCLLYTSPSPRDATLSRMPSSA